MPVIVSLALALSAQPVAADPLGYTINRFMDYVTNEERGSGQHQSDIAAPMRNIPKDSVTGYLSPAISGNWIQIDGREYRLAFNSRIRDEHNRIIQTGMIREKKKIRYTFDSGGRINRIWLLASEEKS